MFSSMITSFSLLELCRSTLFFFFNDTATTEIYTLSLHDALPILSVHDQAGALELAELLPGGPFRDQIRVRDQHPRRVGMRAQDADGLPALHQQGLFIPQRPEGRADPLEAGPVARRLPAAAVDHELFRLLRHLRVEIVLQHPERRFLHPAPARERAPAGGMDRVGHARFYDTVDTFRGWKTGAGT